MSHLYGCIPSHRALITPVAFSSAMRLLIQVDDTSLMRRHLGLQLTSSSLQVLARVTDYLQ